MAFQIKHYIAKDGERFSVLYDATDPGIPLFYPTAYVTRTMRQDKTHATQATALDAIRRICEWERDRKTTLETKLIAGELLTAGDIDGLASHVLSRRTGKATEVISSSKFNNYWNHICPYIQWLTDELLPNRNNLSVRKSVDDQAKRLTAKIIKRKGSKARREQLILEDKLSESVRNELLSLFDDPFKGLKEDHYKGSRLRIVLMIRILYETGMRRGELLGLKLKHFVEASGGQSAYLVIERNHSDETDRRANQPVAKTAGRILPISEELERQLIDYKINYRAELKGVGYSDESFIFSVHHSRKNEGAPLTINGFNSSFGHLISRLPKLGGDLHPHAFRHDWNYRFSALADKDGMAEQDERENRIEAMGWAPDSNMAKVYDKRHRKEKAFEIGKKIARDTERPSKK